MTDPFGLLDLFLLAPPLQRLFALVFRQHVDLQLQQLHLLLQLVLELLQLLLLRITTTVSRDQQNENKNISLSIICGLYPYVINERNAHMHGASCACGAGCETA